MFSNMPKDNSRLYLKLLLRKSLLALAAVEKNAALDLFAGKGELARRIYLDFRELHLVEKDPQQFSRLEAGFAGHAAARTWKMDNRKFLREKLPGLSGLDLVDFDAYGSPNLQIQWFFAHFQVKKPLLVFATDGGILSQIRGGGFAPDLYLAGGLAGPASFDPEKAGARASGYERIIYRNYERLIRGFWDELAKRHNFRIELFKLIEKKGGQVTYYGAIIEPR